MSEQIYTYRDNSFNLNQAYQYTLLIQVDTASFSYAITHNNRLLAWDADCTLNELSNPHQFADQLSANYKEVIIGLPAAGFTLIPTQLFSKDQVNNYARLLDVKANERVLTQVLDAENFIIYKVDENIISAVEKLGLNNTVFSNKGWIIAVAQNNPGNNDIYLHTANGKAAFLYFKDGKIRFYNSFEFKNEDDLAYYTALVIEELGLPANTIHLKLSGSIQAGDTYNIRLAGFFPGITFYNPQILELPAQISSQQVQTLASLSLCASSEAL